MRPKTESSKALEELGYRVVQYLGSGARSSIWHVEDRRTSQAYALKRVVKQNHADYRFLEQAINEGEIGLLFNHAVIRRIYKLRRVKRWWRLKEIHLLMELCEGKTVQDKRPTSTGETVRIFAQVAEALAHMNARGYIHADMKPNNIIVSPCGVVKIIDFGQSCPVGTIKQRIQGTPDFIAPEQVYRRPLDARTDVFNFGASLYWTLTGTAIPTALPKGGSLALPADPVAERVEKLNPDVPAGLSKLVADCIEITPSRRPASMSEVASRIDLISHQIERKNDNIRPEGT